MNERFSDGNLLLMKGVDALSPKSTSFLSVTKMEPFLQHYSKCLPRLENEVIFFKNYLTRKPIPDDELQGSSGLHNLLERTEPVKAAFPILNECHLLLVHQQPRLNAVSRDFVG